jgi:diketogulonate reductase-like aldo/keto reductase
LLAKGAVAKQKHLRELAEKDGKAASQIALRWLSQRGVTEIPKTGRRERLKENLALGQFSLEDAGIELLGRL